MPADLPVDKPSKECNNSSPSRPSTLPIQIPSNASPKKVNFVDEFSNFIANAYLRPREYAALAETYRKGGKPPGPVRPKNGDQGDRACNCTFYLRESPIKKVGNSLEKVSNPSSALVPVNFTYPPVRKSLQHFKPSLAAVEKQFPTPEDVSVRI